MRTLTAGQRIAREAGQAVGVIGTLANRVRILHKDRAEALQRETARRAGPTVQERQDDLARFYDHFENYVEVLCDAAQYGPTPKLERSYQEQRNWVKTNYPTVRSFVIAYLKFEPEEEALGTDAFGMLAQQPDLRSFLDSDDGEMISRITRTREALNIYGEHLRQLAAKKAG